MRVVVQRVSEARVSIGDEVIGAIGPGLCILLGVGTKDTETAAEFLASKIINLRIFEDEQGKMNRSIRDLSGELLVVSQFTLYGDSRKGNRPSFTAAAAPEAAERLYEHFIQRLRQVGLKVATGKFRAHMKIALVNDGPVTLLLES
jgi:D-tyrosyl-tRNA(Tyr) deacylase